MRCLNLGGGTDTQPSYRLRHIYTELGLREGVGGEPLVEEGVGSAPGLKTRERSDALDKEIQDDFAHLSGSTQQD